MQRGIALLGVALPLIIRREDGFFGKEDVVLAIDALS